MFSGLSLAAEIGKKAPNFSLVDIDGQEVQLSDYAGKIVVLEWTNYGCPYVKAHYDDGHMQGLQKSMTENGVVWLSVCSSADGKQGHMSVGDWKRVSAGKGVKSTAILLDEKGDVGRLYGARTTPHMFVIDAQGQLAYDGAINSIRSSDSSDIDKAENYVSQAVSALMAGEAVAVTKTKPYGCGIKYAPYDS